LVFPLLFSVLLLNMNRRRIWGMCLALACGCVITHFSRNPMINACFSYFLCMLSGCACALYWDRLQPMLRNLPAAIWCLAVVLVLGSACIAPPAIICET